MKNCNLLYDVIAAHLLWLETSGISGKRADLKGADLREANLEGADLREANLIGANLDFSSGIPFHCEGTGAKGDDHLFAQMLFHLTRQDWSTCSEEVKKIVKSINKIKSNNGRAVDLFCRYRTDVETQNTFSRLLRTQTKDQIKS